MSKKANGHKAPLRLSNVPSSCKSSRQKSTQTQSKSASQKGIVTPHKRYTMYKPNYVHRRISPHIGRAAYASEKEIVQNSITILIYNNIRCMSRNKSSIYSVILFWGGFS